MPVRLPPLASLQAFETAFRHQSYTRAAEELNLTHGAISHHITALEGRLGVKLFLRERSRMVPTEDGRLLVAKVRQALGLLERSFAPAAPAAIAPLRISVLPSFASRWLVPRLADFQTQLPDIDLTLDVRQDIVDLAAGEADCAVRFGAGGWAELQQEALFEDQQFPVCAPNFRNGDLPRTPDELADCPLLRNPWLPWEPWLHAAGASFKEPRRGIAITDSSVLLDAAAAGLGVALARRILAEGDLRSGRLVRLFDVTVTDTYRYFMVWRADHPQTEAILRVRDWMRAQGP
jgi:LysR family glycine cleavage system transcriptional activator